MSKPRPTSIDVAVSSNLKRLRLAANISQEKLGESIGVTFQQVQKYETGKNRISSGALWSIAKTLGCSVMDFYQGVR